MHPVSPDDVVIIGGGPHPPSASTTAEYTPYRMTVGGQLWGNAEAAALLRFIADELDKQP